jgi:DNA/RNA endonuclease G (NUC1)
METSPKIDPFDLKYLKTCKGYDPQFIAADKHVSLDILNEDHREHLPNVEGNEQGLLNYTNLSVWYNRNRKLPFVSAYNIDGGTKDFVERDGFVFVPDPRFDATQQLNDPFYDLITKKKDGINEFDIGHMASHNEMSWKENAEIKSAQTFHFPNSAPQGSKLNRGLWSKLESYVIEEGADASNKKICVFSGPMMHDTDLPYEKDKSFQIPVFFFKLVVYEYDGQLYSTAFVMSHYLKMVELGLIKEPERLMEKQRVIAYTHPFSDYNHKDVFQVNIELIENYTGLNFYWDNVKRMTFINDVNKLEEIKDTDGLMRRRNQELINIQKKYDESNSDDKKKTRYNITLRPPYIV